MKLVFFFATLKISMTLKYYQYSHTYIPIGGVDGSGVVYIRPLPKGFSDPLREKPKFIFERFHP